MQSVISFSGLVEDVAQATAISERVGKVITKHGGLVFFTKCLLELPQNIRAFVQISSQLDLHTLLMLRSFT